MIGVRFSPMRSAAVNIINMQTVLERRAFIAWRRDVALFMMATGAAQHLEHVSEDQWLRHYTEGEQPEDAVLGELGNVAD